MSEQQLNSLERFRKRSPNLILEQHSSCEVPAGCGGVILRWRNPMAARPVRVHVCTSGLSKCWVDGEPLGHGSVDLAPGRHVLAIAVEVGNRAGALRAALLHDEAVVTAQGGVEGEGPFRVLSKADGTWKVTLEDPAEGWQGLGFDDSAWPPLVGCTIPEEDSGTSGVYQWRACEEAGALGLRVASSLRRGQETFGPALVRKVFEIPAPSTP